MNRNEIFEKLQLLNLDKEKFIIISGASLVVQGILEDTPDIDLSTSRDYYKKINWKKITGAFNFECKVFDVFEISDNLFDEDNIVIINGFKFANIHHILKTKKALNREKDFEIINILEKLI